MDLFQDTKTWFLSKQDEVAKCEERLLHYYSNFNQSVSKLKKKCSDYEITPEMVKEYTNKKSKEYNVNKVSFITILNDAFRYFKANYGSFILKFGVACVWVWCCTALSETAISLLGGSRGEKMRIAILLIAPIIEEFGKLVAAKFNFGKFESFVFNVEEFKMYIGYAAIFGPISPLFFTGRLMVVMMHITLTKLHMGGSGTKSRSIRFCLACAMHMLWNTLAMFRPTGGLWPVITNVIFLFILKIYNLIVNTLNRKR